MIELRGKYAIAKVFTDNIEQMAVSQIIELLNQPFTKGSHICIMPDVHAGKGCVIGTTMTITDKIVPNLVGVDIACGMLTVELFDWIPSEINLRRLDEAIKKRVPSGFDVHDKAVATFDFLERLRCYKYLHDVPRIGRSIGTLGGGNHFIEINRSTGGDKYYMVIHSGSRNLGKQVCEHYQNLAIKETCKIDMDVVAEIKNKLICDGRSSEIAGELKRLKGEVPQKHLAYLAGNSFRDYLHDMQIVTEYSYANRKAMATAIMHELGIHWSDWFTTLHNYIDLVNMMLRKGAVSAQAGEKLLIPLNMRDGSLLCYGRGSPDWNYSAPHGAGRTMSRGNAKRSINIEDFKKSMEGIFTTSVGQSTIDESPFAYKPFEEIIANIGDTVDIVDKIVPVYNFKAGGD